jgi:hypothetical protein
MIKGVTKSIIEIIPKNSCFEKVIIILNNSCDIPDKNEIRSQVELLTRRAPDYLQRQKRSTTLKILVSGAAGALITAASFLILYVFV